MRGFMNEWGSEDGPQNTPPSYSVLKSTSESVFQLLCRASAHARSSLSFSWSVSVICFLITTALVRSACCCVTSPPRSTGSPTRTVSFCRRQKYCWILTRSRDLIWAKNIVWSVSLYFFVSLKLYLYIQVELKHHAIYPQVERPNLGQN